MNTDSKTYYEVVPLSSGELPPNDDNLYICIINDGYAITWKGYVINAVPELCESWLRPTDLTTIIKDAASKGWDASNIFADEQAKYPYGKRDGLYQYPDKEQFINSLTQ